MKRAGDSAGAAASGTDSETRESLRAILSERYRAPLMSFFRRRTSDLSEAEDLAQEVLLRVVQRRDRNALDQPDAFIFQTARNLLADRHRHASVKKKYHADLEIRQESTEGISPERVLQGKQELALVVDALKGLGEQTRNIFLLRRFEQMKYSEIADLYGISVSAVEKHLMKAYARVVEAVGER